jgi:hypothetical protein
MAKSLIIGAFTNYNYNQLKPWAESIDRCGFTGDKVMVVDESTKETIEELINQNFHIVAMNKVNLPIHVSRFLFIYAYLKEHWQEYDYVITTDVKDVYFQTNPVEWLEKNLGDKKLVAGSESLKYIDEPWGNQNLMQTFGEFVYDNFKDNEIYNVGTIGGKSEYVKDLILNIFLSAINRPIPIVDQAVFNVLIQTQPYKDIVKFAQQKDGWACQAGTTVDPSKINSFRPNLLEKEPSFANGLVYTSKCEPFCIVHQYDRVPEWKKFVRESYNQEDESQFFSYKT